ncbi:hypothetical protein JD969_08135 [Planctomycetota bacterium]|nr:hypothetical protein JD969_08135 [Planctomycetota bacterium]
MVCIGLFLGWLYFNGYIPPFLDDGPFVGHEVLAIEDREPEESMWIYPDRYLLEVYETGEGEQSPVVQLKDQNGSVLWAVRPDGHDENDVERIEFDEWYWGWKKYGCVKGMVKWTYGTERCWWYIDSAGQLDGYYYSW